MCVYTHIITALETCSPRVAIAAYSATLPHSLRCLSHFRAPRCSWPSTPAALHPASEIELLQSCHKGAWARGEDTMRAARTSPRKGFELQKKDLEPRSAFSGD